MQKYNTPKGKHLTIDNRRLIEKWKNEGSLIVKSPTYLERLLRPSITRSIGVQPYNKCENGYITRSIQPITHKLFTKAIERGR